MDDFFTKPPSYERTFKQCSIIKSHNPQVKLFPIGKKLSGTKKVCAGFGKH